MCSLRVVCLNNYELDLFTECSVENPHLVVILCTNVELVVIQENPHEIPFYVYLTTSRKLSLKKFCYS